MPEYHVDYMLGGRPWHYAVTGDMAPPSDRCLALGDDDLTDGLSWQAEGFAAVQAWPLSVSEKLLSAVSEVLDEALHAVFNERLDMPLEKYHHIVTDVQHLEVVKWLRKLHYVAKDIFPLQTLDEGLSHVLGVPVSCYAPHLQKHGCSIRIIRPRSTDYNPLHRDGWIDRLRNALNVYIPIAGSTPLSSLSMIPGSHHWNESLLTRTEGNCVVNGMKYTVPSVISSSQPLEAIRPPVEFGEVLVFSPYIIHGGAYNFTEDKTRISMEMRFWKMPSAGE